MASIIRQTGALVLLLILVGFVAFIGGRFTATSVQDWYQQIEKPSWRPPDWVFGPVWTVLYILMAVAAWLVWRKAGFGGAAGPLTLFAIQLVLNALWSYLFFGLESPFAAFVELLALWTAIALTTAAFWRVAPLAGALLLPYLVWVTFAAALNCAIWRMNA
jgi:translocator protein